MSLRSFSARLVQRLTTSILEMLTRRRSTLSASMVDSRIISFRTQRSLHWKLPHVGSRQAAPSVSNGFTIYGMSIHVAKATRGTVSAVGRRYFEEGSFIKEICSLEAPAERTGLGRWEHVVVKKRATKRRKSRDETSEADKAHADSTKEPKSEVDENDDDSKSVLITVRPADCQISTVPLPIYAKDDLNNPKRREPLAAFLGAFWFDELKAEQFYYLAATNFQSIE